MGTSNYHVKNTSKVFSIDPDNSVKDCDDFEWESIWENTRENIISILLAIDKDKTNEIQFYEDETIGIADELRSYPSTSIGNLYIPNVILWEDDSGELDPITMDVNLYPHTTSGYYTGFNLDYEIELCDSFGNSNDNLSDAIRQLDYEADIEYGIEDLDLDTEVRHKLFETIEQLTTKLEEVFETHSDSLNVVGSFSDGTTVYEKDT